MSGLTIFFLSKFTPPLISCTNLLTSPFVNVTHFSSTHPSSPTNPSAFSMSVGVHSGRAGRSSAHLKTKCSMVSVSVLQVEHKISASSNLDVYIFVLRANVLASNSNELPR
uniref:Putative secreted protein n=1 Tax=Amblyomma americanum TaxID=6943 RepID=A0A0C9S3S0_AMBAM